MKVFASVALPVPKFAFEWLVSLLLFGSGLSWRYSQDATLNRQRLAKKNMCKGSLAHFNRIKLLPLLLKVVNRNFYLMFSLKMTGSINMG